MGRTNNANSTQSTLNFGGQKSSTGAFGQNLGSNSAQNKSTTSFNFNTNNNNNRSNQSTFNAGGFNTNQNNKPFNQPTNNSQTSLNFGSS